ncbi:hypothetical protein JCM3765_005170 [Sporobolomyces pararoseus]
MSRKHLFTTLRADQARDDIFLYHILESSSDCFTRLVIDDNFDLETLSFILFFVVPRLPNLQSICAPAAQLPRSDMLRISGHKMPSPTSSVIKERTVASKLLKLSERITSWTLFPAPFDSCLPYLSIRPELLISLSIGESPIRRLLSSPNSPLLPILLRCNSLQNLNFAHYSAGMDQDEPWFHPDVVTSPFPFLETLSSFSLSLPQGHPMSLSIDSSVYLFVQRFVKLKHLELRCDQSTERRQQNPRIVLPHLETLSVASDSLITTHSVLTNLSLPTLHRLSISYFSILPDPLEIAGEDHAPLLSELSNELRASITSSRLQTVYIEAENGHLVDSEVKELFQQERWDDLRVVTSWFRGQTEASWARHCDNEQDRKSLVGVVQKEMENLAGWTMEQSKLMKNREDLTGLSQLWEGMETLRQLRKWKEDM